MDVNFENINKILNNSNNIYYGHGTGTQPEVIKSIFENGLRCDDGSLNQTSETLGIGGSIDKNEYDLLNNWHHISAKTIIIVSIPKNYRICESSYFNTTLKEHRAFSYQIKERNGLLNPGYYILPQFVAGYYDANEKKFFQNPKYYELLSQEKQTELFELIRGNYLDVLEQSCGIDFYKENIEAHPSYDFALTDEEYKEYCGDASSKLFI